MPETQEIAKRDPRSSFNDEDVELGLLTLAMCSGNRIKAQAALAEAGLTVHHSTLHKWRDRDPERYAQIQAELMPEIHGRIAERAEEAINYLAELEMDLARQLKEKSEKLTPNETAGALRNVSTSKAINVDKSLLLRGRPTQIRATADVTQLLKDLTSRFSGVIAVDAEEVPDSHEPDARAVDTPVARRSAHSVALNTRGTANS